MGLETPHRQGAICADPPHRHVLGLLQRYHRLFLLPAFLAGVELVETVSNNWDRQTDDENSEDCTKAAKYLSEAVLGDDITVTDLMNVYFIVVLDF